MWKYLYFQILWKFISILNIKKNRFYGFFRYPKFKNAQILRKFIYEIIIKKKYSNSIKIYKYLKFKNAQKEIYMWKYLNLKNVQ